jgi:hypothetical protein
VLKGFAPASLLDSYEVERQPIGRQVIDAASAIHELFMAGRNSGPEGLVALRDSGFLADLVGKVSGVAYHYRKEGSSAGALPAAGDRMPNVRLAAGSAAAWSTDLLRHTSFTLLTAVPAGAADGSLERWSDTIASRYRGRVAAHVVARAPAELTGTGGARCYLVRPDGYVAASAPAAERGAIERSLTESLL